VSLLVEHMLEKQPAQRPTARELVSAIAAATTTTAAQHTATRDRSARVIAPHVGVPSPQAPTTELATTDIIVKRPLVVVRGTGQAGLSIALAVNGFDVIEAADTATDEPGSGVEILLWASVDDVARRVAAGATVIAGADPEDLGKIAALVHAGAAEVLGTPVAVDELAPRVVRAQRRAARRKARP
jgi:hypothetical protein